MPAEDTISNAGLRVTVAGSGYMGGGIAQVLALSGAVVTLADVSAEVASRNYDRLIAEARTFEANELFPPSAADTLAGRLRTAESIEAAADAADYIVEAVPERLDIKHDTLHRLSQAAPADAIIASNTSTISIGKLAQAVTHPERFIGAHFSNPAPFIPGVEIISHEGTAPEVIDRTEKIIQAAGKQTARVKDSTGFVLNRLQYALFSEAIRLVEEGVASTEDIDTIVRTTLGHRLPFFGPFAIADMAGLDVYAFCYQSLQAAYPDRFTAPRLLTDLVEHGKLGTKAGGGFLPLTADRIPALIAYRDKAYVAMSTLLTQTGPAPLT